jgi:hypothetical protein
MAMAFALATAAFGQQYQITTVAGGGLPATPVAALTAGLGYVEWVAADSAGNLYFSSYSFNAVFKLDRAGSVTRVAGASGPSGYSGDGGEATSAQLSGPAGLAVDALGNLYIAESTGDRVRMVTPDGTISTVAGNGNDGYSGDGGPATSASLSCPAGVAVDSGGNLYIADECNNRIRKVTPDGKIATWAGDGSYAYSGDGGPATAAELAYPSAVAVDSAGNLYIADSNNSVIRKVSPDGTITTIAGQASQWGFSGDRGLRPALFSATPSASLWMPRATSISQMRTTRESAKSRLTAQSRQQQATAARVQVPQATEVRPRQPVCPTPTV